MHSSTTGCLRISMFAFAAFLQSSTAFTIQPSGMPVTVLPIRTTTTTQLEMGLFDGVKDAFSAPALERGTLDSERETPIDRWMGWSVSKDNQQQAPNAVPSDYIDAMDVSNYVTVQLTKPMGIVFEENDEEYGGIFVQSLKEDSAAAAVLQPGDQLVGVNVLKVSGKAFDDALNAIVESTGATTKLVLFRGNAKQLYGPTGASQAWLDELLLSGGGSGDAAADVTKEEA